MDPERERGRRVRRKLLGNCQLHQKRTKGNQDKHLQGGRGRGPRPAASGNGTWRWSGSAPSCPPPILGGFRQPGRSQEVVRSRAGLRSGPGYRANVSHTAARGRGFKRTACTLTSISVSRAPRRFQKARFLEYGGADSPADQGELRPQVIHSDHGHGERARVSPKPSGCAAQATAIPRSKHCQTRVLQKQVVFACHEASR